MKLTEQRCFTGTVFTRSKHTIVICVILFTLIPHSGVCLEAAAIGRAKLYGPGVQLDGLSNSQVAEVDVDYRFRASVNGAVASFLWYDAYGRLGVPSRCDGYGCGSGGRVEICIYTDDGTTMHYITGKPLACLSGSNLRTGAYLRRETFPSPPVLIGGKLYHLHWHNSDPNPATNYISVDNIFVWHPSSPAQPTVSDSDLAVLSGTTMQRDLSPIFQLNYTDGSIQGQGYMDSWIEAPAEVSGESRVRETFTVSGRTRKVTSVSVRANRVLGKNALNVLLADNLGKIIEQGALPASNFPEGDLVLSGGRCIQVWVTYNFAQPHALVSGQSYQLVFSAPSDSRYQMYGIRKGKLYHFAPPTYFGDGYGQFSRDNGSTWTGFTQPGGRFDNTDADVQFFFSTQAD